MSSELLFLIFGFGTKTASYVQCKTFLSRLRQKRKRLYHGLYVLSSWAFWIHGYNNNPPPNMHIASLWFYCWSRMAFPKTNFNGQASTNVFLYLCNWSLWNMIGKIHRIIGHILYLVNHQASAINIAAFRNLDLCPALPRTLRIAWDRGWSTAQATWTVLCARVCFSACFVCWGNCRFHDTGISPRLWHLTSAHTNRVGPRKQNRSCGWTCAYIVMTKKKGSWAPKYMS